MFWAHENHHWFSSIYFNINLIISSLASQRLWSHSFLVYFLKAQLVLFFLNWSWPGYQETKPMCKNQQIRFEFLILSRSHIFPIHGISLPQTRKSPEDEQGDWCLDFHIVISHYVWGIYSRLCIDHQPHTYSIEYV